jgi:murein DD-endopeptidase MepM/ murein hydrolase activator NlpD
MDNHPSIPVATKRVIRVATRVFLSASRVPPGLGAGIAASTVAAALALAGTLAPSAAMTVPESARPLALQTLVVPDTAAATPVRRDGYDVSAPKPRVGWPVSALTRVRDGFGPRVAPCAGCSSMHAGVDFDAGDGAPVRAIADGTVLANNPTQGPLGTHVSIRHVINGRMLVSVYGHLRAGSTRFHPGDVVVRGDPIGLVGNTGRSTGPHLHFEIRLDGVTPIDPLGWLSSEVG